MNGQITGQVGRQQATKELMGPPRIQGTEGARERRRIFTPGHCQAEVIFFGVVAIKATPPTPSEDGKGRERGRDENRETTLFIPNFSRFWKFGGPLDAFN